jgi:thermostable 8-oxoguanine DNA glycosylase
MTTHSHTNKKKASPNSSTAHKKPEVMQGKHSSHSAKKQAGQGIRKIPRACQKRITQFYHHLTAKDVKRYVEDWKSLTPTTDPQRANRWKFAYCTIHTPWERSCEQFEKIKGHYGHTELTTLRRALSSTSGGMYDLKSKAIHHFQLAWKNDTPLFEPTNNWQDFRDKLVTELPGIGYAKTSFALEMIYPNEAKCLCLDRHMLKACGWTDVNSTVSKDQYRYYEDYWLDISREYKVPPVISRNIYWDQIQQQPNSFYWANSLT